MLLGTSFSSVLYAGTGSDKGSADSALAAAAKASADLILAVVVVIVIVGLGVVTHFVCKRQPLQRETREIP